MSRISLSSTGHLCLFLASFLFAGCGSDEEGSALLEPIEEAGMAAYLGMFEPDRVEVRNSRVTYHYFDFDEDRRSPTCFNGDPYHVVTRDAPVETDDVVIFMMGGGACFTNIDGSLTTNCAKKSQPFLPFGILNREYPGTQDMNVVFLAYCDASLFIGDVDRPFDDDPIVYQRGLLNLSAALDIAKAYYPNPERLLLTGVSGGAFASISSMPLVRYVYPDPELWVLNDSGVGVASTGDGGAFVENLLEEINASKFVPSSCVDCFADGQATNLLKWQLDNDSKMRLAHLSYLEDDTIAGTFLRIPPEDFAAELLSMTSELAETYPSRYGRFIVPGSLHTMLLSPAERSDVGTIDVTSNGVSAYDWVNAFLADSDDWINLVQTE